MTSLNALTLRINANTDGVSKAVNAVRSDVTRINRIMGQTASATDKARQATESLNRVYRTGAISRQQYKKAQQAIKQKYKETDSAASRLRKSIAALGVAFAGLRVASAFTGKMRETFDRIDQLAKTADKLGIATDKLGALRFAAAETGVATSTLDMALQRMVRRVSEAAQGTGEAQGAIAELGLTAATLARMSPDEQFKAIADAMSGVGNQSDRLRLAFKLFDSEGAALVNTLKIGSDGLTAYEEAAERLGYAVNRFDAAQIEKANDAFARMGLVIEGVQNKIAIALAPVVEGLSNTLVDWGTNTEISGKQISGVLRNIGKAVGFVQNGIDIWIRVFKSVRAYVSEFFAWMARQVQNLSQTIADVLNKIPGVETAPLEFTSAFADEMEAAARRARKEADAAWDKPLPSTSVDNFFNKLDQNIEKSRQDFEQAMKPTEASTGIGQFLQPFRELLQMGSALTQQRQSQKPIKVEMPSTATRGSREEYELLRKAQNDVFNKEMAERRKQTGKLSQIATGVNEFADAMTDGFRGLAEAFQTGEAV